MLSLVKIVFLNVVVFSEMLCLVKCYIGLTFRATVTNWIILKYLSKGKLGHKSMASDSNPFTWITEKPMSSNLSCQKSKKSVTVPHWHSQVAKGKKGAKLELWLQKWDIHKNTLNKQNMQTMEGTTLKWSAQIDIWQDACEPLLPQAPVPTPAHAFCGTG